MKELVNRFTLKIFTKFLNPDPYFFLNLVYHNLGQDQRGKEAFEKAFTLIAEQIPTMNTPEWANWVMNKLVEKLQSDE